MENTLENNNNNKIYIEIKADNPNKLTSSNIENHGKCWPSSRSTFIFSIIVYLFWLLKEFYYINCFKFNFQSGYSMHNKGKSVA